MEFWLVIEAITGFCPALHGAENPRVSLDKSDDRPVWLQASGGMNTLVSTEAPVDSDRDGMPDTWDKALGLMPADGSDSPGDRDGDGYTQVEEFLNSLAGKQN